MMSCCFLLYHFHYLTSCNFCTSYESRSFLIDNIHPVMYLPVLLHYSTVCKYVALAVTQTEQTCNHHPLQLTLILTPAEVNQKSPDKLDVIYWAGPLSLLSRSSGCSRNRRAVYFHYCFQLT